MSNVENCGYRDEHAPHSWFEGDNEHHYCDGTVEDPYDEEGQERLEQLGFYD